MVMEFEFDSAKDASNKKDHEGLSLADAALMDWNGMIVIPDERYKYDERFEYAEDRYRGIALIGDRLHSVIYTPRGENLRIISLRRASNKEIEHYEQN